MIMEVTRSLFRCLARQLMRTEQVNQYDGILIYTMNFISLLNIWHYFHESGDVS
jgi:hypothetical protein